MATVDPFQQAFAKQAAAIYAAEGPVSGAYRRHSEFLCDVVDAAMEGGLRGKRVIDLGAGTGMTTRALLGYGPRHVLAVDKSADMLALMRTVMQTSDDIRSYIRSLGAAEVLGDLFESLVAYLERMREDVRTSVSFRNGGSLEIVNKSGLDLVLGDIGDYRGVDALIGNHVLHWLVRDGIPSNMEEGRTWKSAREMALLSALGRVNCLVKPKGMVGFLGPKDFFAFDDSPERDEDLNSEGLGTHPATILFHQIVNRLLMQEHGITRETPPRSQPLYFNSTIRKQFGEAGFDLLRVHHREITMDASIPDVLMVRLQMWIGEQKLAVEDKVALGRKARDLFVAEATPEMLRRPIHEQILVMVARKR